MEIRDVMTPDIDVALPEDTIRAAMKLIAELDVDALPVSEDNLLIGMITARDIATRIVATGCDPKQTRVAQAMVGEVLYCFEDEPVSDVAQKMGGWWVRRLPVVNRDKRLVGTVSLADLTAIEAAPKSGELSTYLRRLQAPRRPRQSPRDRRIAKAA